MKMYINFNFQFWTYTVSQGYIMVLRTLKNVCHCTYSPIISSIYITFPKSHHVTHTHTHTHTGSEGKKSSKNGKKRIIGMNSK